MLCECKSSRQVEQIGSWDGCPLKGGHTQFYVQRCRTCGGVSGFPSANFELALKDGTDETKATLAQIIDENPTRAIDSDTKSEVD